ncbi:BaiN/RdsA family NAD(P)/FAD-dependent oxidoreductase [Tautonia sociabilis]|uniref:NAD(P)/FAD-dependent oxidoreductase n=1 Tax=Tautonia sociabilis TaxID=2080755 RepID=A0A432MGP2_9BACT|nr:NAD(P)/FAD-dependent oxidoreductase [Tautonia sociabilis]RUL85934.1 NAD(P)/FAD-dependent oxidoreductase [Tautonia sociabilis]
MSVAESIYDVAVLGAGAAGLFAASRAAERGRRVLLVEKNRRPGVKILMSGGTRCNITNARGLKDLSVVSGPIDPAFDPKEARGARGIMLAFGDKGRFLASSLRSLSVERTVALFEAEGVATKIEGNGKVFPVSDRAVDVLDALLRRLVRSGAELRTESPCGGVTTDPDGEGFLVRLPNGSIRARRVVVAVGGRSYPGSGTTGDGYEIARSFGHTIVDPRPALVPIRVEAEWVRELKGITISDAIARILPPSGPALAERREAVLFAHFGLTGPAVLDVSGVVARRDDPGTLSIGLDVLPGDRAEALDARLQADSRTGRRSVAGLLSQDLPKRLALALMRASGVPEDRIGPELGRDERRRLVSSIKALRLPIAGTLGFAKAEVTSGGVSLDEVDPDTLQSRLCPGLHFIGEVLDLDGRIGGYNFQAAWSTGWRCGEVV